MWSSSSPSSPRIHRPRPRRLPTCTFVLRRNTSFAICLLFEYRPFCLTFCHSWITMVSYSWFLLSPAYRSRPCCYNLSSPPSNLVAPDRRIQSWFIAVLAISPSILLSSPSQFAHGLQCWIPGFAILLICLITTENVNFYFFISKYVFDESSFCKINYCLYFFTSKFVFDLSSFLKISSFWLCLQNFQFLNFASKLCFWFQRIMSYILFPPAPSKKKWSMSTCF